MFENNPYVVKFPPLPDDKKWYRVAIFEGDKPVAVIFADNPYHFYTTVLLTDSRDYHGLFCEYCNKLLVKENIRLNEIYDTVGSAVQHNMKYIAFGVNENDILIKFNSFNEFKKWELEAHKKLCKKEESNGGVPQVCGSEIK
jgi:hypothetical protein